MFRWILLALAVAFLAVSLLTTVKSPDWAPWRLAVLAGEYGHWLAPLPLLVAALAWAGRGPAPALAVVTLLFGAVATGLLLKPAFQAAQAGRTLPEKLGRAFGRVEIGRAPFSMGGLFGRRPAAVPAKTLTFSGTLAFDFFPAVNAARPAPCVIVVHGGGWDNGDRAQIPQLNHWLARRGYAVAAISYRLAPRFPWPAQRNDVQAALAFLKDHARELGLDATRFVLLGRSAGGQIAEAFAYTADDPAVRGVVALYAPADLHFAYTFGREDDVLKSPRLLRQFLGGPPESAAANYDSASGYRHAGKAAPPTLLVHGQLDTLVWHRQSERLAARLAEHGAPHVFVSLPWATHAFEYNLSGPGGQLTTFALEWYLAAVTR